MIRRALLVALVVCSAALLVAAAQSVSADHLSGTPTPDGADDEQSDSAEANGRSDEDRTDEGNRTQDRGGTGPDREERGTENRSAIRPGRALGLNWTVGTVTLNGSVGATSGVVAADGDGDPDVRLTGAGDRPTDVGRLLHHATGGQTEEESLADGTGAVVDVELDGDLFDDTGWIQGGTVTVGGIVVTLDPPRLREQPDDGEAGDRRSPHAGPGGDGDAAAATLAAAAGDAGPTPPRPEPPVRAGEGEQEPAGGAPGDDGGDGPGSGAGAGAALVVTVGFLGGTRPVLDGTATVASQGPGSTLAALRQQVEHALTGLPDHVVPPVVGYSRHDSSDPLENETRAAIHDLVRESPGIYHARLAEETGVAVETVRYHCRILAEEGLVEPRKHRGKRRLYPVSMDEADPALAAAIADSAAADVLGAIRRLEPATLSAVAEHVDCAPSTVAHHLDRLEEDGLVARERDGGAVKVRLRRSTRSALDNTVADD